MTLLLEDPPQPLTRKPVTAQQLLSLPDQDRFELVNNEIVERCMGWESELFGSRLLIQLGAYCEQAGLGEVNGSNASYQCFGHAFPDDPDRVRKPDVSFIAAKRLPRSSEIKGHCMIAPDLAVEVVSPHDLYGDVEAKVDEYLQAGVKLVWVVDPRTKSIRIHRPDGTVQDLGLKDELNGEDIVPGFRCAVSHIFKATT